MREEFLNLVLLVQESAKKQFAEKKRTENKLDMLRILLLLVQMFTKMLCADGDCQRCVES